MKRIDRRVIGVVAAAIGLAACVQTPVAPMIPVAPGPNKTFDAFGADQAVCQQYAAAQTAPAVAAANNQAVGGAILTTALGAGLGAAIGAASGAGLGTVVGASGSSYAQMSVQQQYDILYGQCMAAHGNSVPGFSPPPDAPRYPGGAGPGPQPYPGAPAPPPPGYGPPGYGSPAY